MIKVLLVSPYSENLVGGIANWTKYIVNYHHGSADGIDLHLLNNVNAKSVPLTNNIAKRLSSGLKNYIPVLKEFKTKISKERYDVVHICSSASLGLVRDLVFVHEAQKKGIKTFVHMHFGRIPQILESKGWEHWLLRKLMNGIDCAVVMDHYSLNALIKRGYKNAVYLPNPLSTEVQSLIEKCNVDRREPRTIVFAGHVCPSKGVYELVEACKEIKNVRLVILGKETVPGTQDKLFEIVGDGAEKWLTLLGNQPMAKVISYMKACTVFVLPSYSEGFPNVILESMACGCPIVSTNVGAIPEILDSEQGRKYGICVKPKQVIELRDAIIWILNNPQESRNMGLNAQKRVNDLYSMPKVWNQLIGIWKSVAEKQ